MNTKEEGARRNSGLGSSAARQLGSLGGGAKLPSAECQVPSSPTFLLPPSSSLYELLSSGAWHASPTRLAAAAGGGLAGAVGIALLEPRWWPLALPFVCAGSFGAWGLAARRLAELDLHAAPADRLRLVLQASKVALAVAGTVAALTGLALVFLLVLGPSWSH